MLFTMNQQAYFFIKHSYSISACLFKILSLLTLFLTPHLAFSQHFAIISDIHGASISTLQVSQLVKSRNPEFIITSGDNHYESLSGIDEQIGPYYSDFIHPYIGNYGNGDTINRFFPCIGNHDVELNGFNSYLNYFTLPGNERYYDFVKGNVHFFALDCLTTEPDGISDTSVQAFWLKNKLALSVSPFKVVYFHYSPYTSGYHGNTNYMHWPFKQWGASIVISGHDHDYERLMIDSLPYLVCGVGGGALYTIYNPLPGNQLFDGIHHGAVFVTVSPDSAVFQFQSTNGLLIDEFVLFKTQACLHINDLQNAPEFFHFTCSPNPVKETIRIEFELSHAENVEFSLSDASGKMLYTIPKKHYDSGKHFIQLNCNDFTPGIHFLYLKSGEVPFVHKFVLTK